MDFTDTHICCLRIVEHESNWSNKCIEFFYFLCGIMFWLLSYFEFLIRYSLFVGSLNFIRVISSKYFMVVFGGFYCFHNQNLSNYWIFTRTENYFYGLSSFLPTQSFLILLKEKYFEIEISLRLDIREIKSIYLAFGGEAKIITLSIFLERN